ncbi:uncharacterized protein LOC110452055 [Mizuhopecten yessoensis]|uniref:Acyl-CoA synthetase family member 2, mitochondrial n=1 Tax=Mizuhopecten yessoensis TaxID=6573 RepID=A0A210R575_MIZYE|nr:uncharacterized protein LOC110452055 [Mizuhopecten yessoensis]OWF56071.1 Acyl-CoA synthetase family member 2, mitochondrial [Mizuhopecten yessoensis]
MASQSRLSYLYSCPAKPFNYTTLPRVVKDNSKTHPDQEIFVIRRLDGSRSSLTNTSLYHQSSQLAKYLASIGIQKGDRVALIGPNTLEMVVGYVGIMCAGAVVLNVNIDMTTDQNAHETFRLTGTKLVVVDSGEKAELLPAIKAMLQHSNFQNDQEQGKEHINVAMLRTANLDGYQDVPTFKSIAAKDLSHIALPETFPEEPAVIFTTSGSTGKPKMVVHTHNNLACSPFSWIPDVDYESIDYNDRPFSWIGGTPVFHILLRRSRIFMNSALTINGKNTDFLWKVMKEERCSDALLFPYIIRDLLDLSQKNTDDGYRLNHVATGGQMIDSLYAKIMDKFCNHLVIVYGCTEIMATNMFGPLVKGDTLISGEVGRPYPGVEVRIVDEQELPVLKGTVGKVQLRGPSSMREYYGDQQLTANSFATGAWFRTGDIGKISCNDSLVIIGREKDVISRGGRKIYPGMLEDLIKHIPFIKYVCVVPVPDRRLYEEICVCFMRSDASEMTKEDVKKFCEEHLYADGTVDGIGVMPAYYVQFEEFPLLSNGKPDKGAIRDEAVNRLHLSLN